MGGPISGVGCAYDDEYKGTWGFGVDVFALLIVVISLRICQSDQTVHYE